MARRAAHSQQNTHTHTCRSPVLVEHSSDKLRKHGSSWKSSRLAPFCLLAAVCLYVEVQEKTDEGEHVGGDGVGKPAWEAASAKGVAAVVCGNGHELGLRATQRRSNVTIMGKDVISGILS